MVGCCVEEQKIGLLHEQASQVRTHDPTAAESPDGSVEVAFSKCQTGEDLLRARFDVPCIIARVCGCDTHHRLVADGLRFLREKSQPGAALERDAAFIGRVFTKDEREERRFSGTVGAHQPNALAAIYLDRGIPEKRAAAERCGTLRHREHERRRRLSASGVLASPALNESATGTILKLRQPSAMVPVRSGASSTHESPHR